MADRFDRFLETALSPPERVPDRRFVAAVQARILLEDRLAAQRRALVASALKQLVALLAVTGSVWVVTRAKPVANLLAAEPAVALGGLLAVFALAVALFAWRSAPDVDGAAAI
jgi:protein-S-isoprenylcysteine O-methyltransferase Ste14